MITALHPSGIEDPVNILMHSPFLSFLLGIVPAGTTPIQFRDIGFDLVACFKSELIMAYPSMAELSNPGRSTLDIKLELL